MTVASVRPIPDSRLEREIARERDQRLKNDDERTGASVDDFRHKDARDNTGSSQLHRARAR